jgi:predicted nuclease with TOPRIM domain
MKLDPEKFFEIKLAAMLRENTQMQFELAQAQENMAKLMAENSALKKQALQGKIKEADDRFAGLAEGLKQYGASLENIDWSTGEFKNTESDPSPAS